MINSKITNILQILALWWDSCSKSDSDILYLIQGKITIDSYKFVIISGHRAFLNAINETTHLSIIDCGAPDTEFELICNLKKKLMSNLQNVPN